MNFKAHFTFGIFTALLVYYFTNSIIASLIMFTIQIMLILDFIFKKIMNFEPLHSILAMLVAWFVSFLIVPVYHWYVLLAYSSHLFLDIFVYEEIPLLYPFKKQFMYPIKNSEKFVIICSTVGSLLLVGLTIL